MTSKYINNIYVLLIVLTIIAPMVYPADSKGQPAVTSLGSAKDYCRIKTNDYTAIIDGFGRMKLKVDGKDLFDGQFMQRWRINQNEQYVKNISGNIEKSPDNKTITITFNYSWNNGEVLENIVITCRDISVDYKYTANEKIECRNFAYLLRFKNIPDKNCIYNGGVYEKNDGVIDFMKQVKKSNQRYSYLTFQNLHKKHFDLVALNDSTISIYRKMDIGIANNGRFWQRQELNKGESFDLSFYIRLSNTDKTNINDNIPEISE